MLAITRPPAPAASYRPSRTAVRLPTFGSAPICLAHAALDRGRKVERKGDRNGVAHHLVAVDNALVAERVAVWECLYPCALPHAEPAIEALVAWHEAKLVYTDLLHAWSARMQWRVPSTRLNRERGLAPIPDTIARHIDRTKAAY